MKHFGLKISFIFLASVSLAKAQENIAPADLSSSILASKEKKLNIGGYGQVDFSKPIISGTETTASIDVHRLVLSFGYNFSDKTQFYSEVEFEHVKELFVEQAFLHHSFNDYIAFRAGLMLVPMGIINEYHEPPTFNGVNRPDVDYIIVPTTWREIGAGFTGRFQEAGLKYQVYIFNGFKSYDGTEGLITGSKFLRDGRQKGAESIMNSPNLSAKLDYFGIPGLKLGLSGYTGKTESSLYNNLDKSDNIAVSLADSSILKINMAGFDIRYQKSGFSLRGEYIISSIHNSDEYNAFTGNDVGRSVNGLYAEVAYNVLTLTSSSHQLTPFFRFEHYDTHFRVDINTSKQDEYNINEVVFGIGWKLTEGTVIKADMQLTKSKTDVSYNKLFNAGIGISF